MRIPWNTNIRVSFHAQQTHWANTWMASMLCDIPIAYLAYNAMLIQCGVTRMADANVNTTHRQAHNTRTIMQLPVGWQTRSIVCRCDVVGKHLRTRHKHWQTTWSHHRTRASPAFRDGHRRRRTAVASPIELALRHLIIWLNSTE